MPRTSLCVPWLWRIPKARVFRHYALGDHSAEVRTFPMAMAFSRTMRSLADDRPSCILVSVMLMALLLGGWMVWGFLARVTV